MKQFTLSRMVAVLAVSMLPVAAFAQTAPAGTHPAHSEASMLKNMSENVDAHISALRTQLQITPAEEPQWTAFAQVMRTNASEMEAAFTQRGQTLATMNAAENLQSYAQIAQVQSDNMQKLSSAFQALYTSFPAAQQKVADGVFRAQQVKH